MELQLHRCGEWSHGAMQVSLKRKNGERAHRIIQPRSHTADESLRLSLIENESGNGVNKKVPLLDRWKGWPQNFVAAPRYSSLLKLTRRRSHELRMETRDRVFLSISEWVFRRVKDPLVEIDPVTVNEAILAEKKGATVAATASPSLFGYLPPGFPRGAGGAALAAGIVVLLATLGTAAILAVLGRGRTAGSVAQGREGNGSVTNGGARKEFEDDRAATGQAGRRPVPVVVSSFESQATPYTPIPQYSTALEQSDLPLPPSFGTRTTPSSSSVADSPMVPTPLPHEVPPVEEANEAVDEEGVSNGVVKGDSALEVAAIVAVLESAAIPEAAESSALQEELTDETTGVELDSLTEDEPVVVDGVVPSASESLEGEEEEEFLEISGGEEYILIGESDSLSSIAELPAPAEPIAALPATADVGVPVDSILVDKPFAQPPSQEVDEERRKEYTQVVERVLPAVSVGAGVAALSSFSGVDGALQVVGALATASFVGEFIWAGPRQQLFDEIRSIKSHKELMQFLADKNIFPHLWSQ